MVGQEFLKGQAMTFPNMLQYAFFLLLVTLLVKPVGGYLARVFGGERTLLDPVLKPVERGIYRVTMVDADHEMNWKQYALSFLAAGGAGSVMLFAILKMQEVLPWFFAQNQATPMTADLALNTSISFATTTTWQAYGGETTMSYASQMIGLAAQNFLAGAAGLAVGIAFIRGLARHDSGGLGNFWVDFTRALLWVLLPVSIVGTIFLVWQGVPLNFNAYTIARTVTGDTQLIAQGPVAALEVIKNLGTNGGGFFNVNGAHPFETPTPLVNLFHMLAIAVLPAALTHTFGRMVGNVRQGWPLYWVMFVLFALGIFLAAWAEQEGNPALTDLGVNQDVAIAGVEAPGGNMEGKEIRFGIGGTVLAAITTSNGATGSYNAMHDSFTPLGVAVPLINMLLGEIVFGGLGTGIFSMMLVVLLGVFLAGLMVGRTPEFLGKTVGPWEMRLIVLASVLSPIVILSFTGIAVVASGGLAGLVTNDGAHGLTEIFYAYATSFANNGQNMAGLAANTPFYNLTTLAVMLIGRFGLGFLALALAGSFAAARRRTVSEGSLPTDRGLFGGVMIGVAVIVGALSYFPVVALGPIAEFLMQRGA